ncbi:MAG: dienelactone hydrolase family protein [SAR324 cluster bacterium]|nr:dienelactone hydrolase family protein [SAR324 cluster bacterium]
MIETTVDLATADGAMPTFITHPEAGGPHPAVIFYMDAPGMREELRDFARRMATVGYYVLLPNLYYRDGGPTFPPAAERSDEDSKRMFALMDALTNARILEDTQPMVAHAEADPAASAGSMGCIGYCMSGQYVLTVAGTHPERFKAMGVPPNRVDVTSSLKWDTAQIHDSVKGAEELAEALGIEASRALWVCGSTGPGEETIILDAYRMLLNTSKSRPPRLAIVPRKPERFDEVARLIRAAGFECVRRSERAGEAAASSVSSSTVILGDTMGELRKFYSLASVVFVGRSLVAMGGSDPIEAAALGRPILAGPHMENFALPIESFREADAIREVHSDRTLALAVDALVAQPAEATAMGQRAQQVVRDHQGATQRTADHIVELLATCDARSVERPAEQPATS